MSFKALLRLARATTVAAVTVAASGPPVFAAINQVALHLASVRCEKERLRQKVAEALYPVRIQSISCPWALDCESRSNNQVLPGACPEASSGLRAAPPVPSTLLPSSRQVRVTSRSAGHICGAAGSPHRTPWQAGVICPPGCARKVAIAFFGN